jgi:hypothetical protein
MNTTTEDRQAKTDDYMEFREVTNAAQTNADIQVYFLGVLVHTIKDAWTRPGGYVYCEREAAVRQAQHAIQRLWDQVESAR